MKSYADSNPVLLSISQKISDEEQKYLAEFLGQAVRMGHGFGWTEAMDFVKQEYGEEAAQKIEKKRDELKQAIADAIMAELLRVKSGSTNDES